MSKYIFSKTLQLYKSMKKMEKASKKAEIEINKNKYNKSNKSQVPFSADSPTRIKQNTLILEYSDNYMRKIYSQGGTHPGRRDTTIPENLIKYAHAINKTTEYSKYNHSEVTTPAYSQKYHEYNKINKMNFLYNSNKLQKQGKKKFTEYKYKPSNLLQLCNASRSFVNILKNKNFKLLNHYKNSTIVSINADSKELPNSSKEIKESLKLNLEKFKPENMVRLKTSYFKKKMEGKLMIKDLDHIYLQQRAFNMLHKNNSLKTSTSNKVQKESNLGIDSNNNNFFNAMNINSQHFFASLNGTIGNKRTMEKLELWIDYMKEVIQKKENDKLKQITSERSIYQLALVEILRQIGRFDPKKGQFMRELLYQFVRSSKYLIRNLKKQFNHQKEECNNVLNRFIKAHTKISVKNKDQTIINDSLKNQIEETNQKIEELKQNNICINEKIDQYEKILLSEKEKIKKLTDISIKYKERVEELEEKQEKLLEN